MFRGVISGIVELNLVLDEGAVGLGGALHYLEGALVDLAVVQRGRLSAAAGIHY